MTAQDHHFDDLMAHDGVVPANLEEAQRLERMHHQCRSKSCLSLRTARLYILAVHGQD